MTYETGHDERDPPPEIQGTRNASGIPNATEFWPQPLDFEAMSGREPELPKFLLQDWMPAGYATLFAGHGGVGKSGIALHQAVCLAMGKPFFGIECDRRKVMYLSCEDRENVLHWRLSRICAYEGITIADLKGSLCLLDLVGRDTTLWMPPTGYTVGLEELRAQFIVNECEVLYVDGISDTFAGNENAKVDVKRYVNALIGLINPDRGGVVLIGHVSKPSSSLGGQGDGYSGTTGWHNSVRARWYLYPEKRSGGEDGTEVTGDLLLDLQKSNLGPADQSMRFHWDTEAHMFVGSNVVGEDNFERKHRERTERAGILECIGICYASKTLIPATVHGRRTGYHVLSAMEVFPKTLKSGSAQCTKRFNRMVLELQHSGDIAVDTIKTLNRKLIDVLVLKGKS